MLPGLPTPQSSTFLQALNDVQTINNLRAQGALTNSQAMNQNALTQAQMIKNQYLPQLQQIGLQQEQGKVYQDPILQRGYEIGLANQNGTIPQGFINGLGINNMGQAGSSPAMQMGVNNRQNISQVLGSQNSPGNYSPGQMWALTGNPNPYMGLYLKQLESQAGTTGTNTANQYTDLINQAKNESDQANQGLALVQQFTEHYPKATNTGSVLGRLPAITSDDQLLDKSSAGLNALMGQGIGNSKVTDKDLSLAGDMNGLQRKTNKAAVDNVASLYTATLNQAKEKQLFIQKAMDMGLTPAQINNQWASYTAQRRPFDFKTGKINPEMANSWNDYLSSDAINSLKEGKPHIPIPSTFKNQDEAQAWAKSLSPGDREILRQQTKGM